jgi:hypothetical protein
VTHLNEFCLFIFYEPLDSSADGICPASICLHGLR